MGNRILQITDSEKDLASDCTVLSDTALEVYREDAGFTVIVVSDAAKIYVDITAAITRIRVVLYAETGTKIWSHRSFAVDIEAYRNPPKSDFSSYFYFGRNSCFPMSADFVMITGIVVFQHLRYLCNGLCVDDDFTFFRNMEQIVSDGLLARQPDQIDGNGIVQIILPVGIEQLGHGENGI